MILARAAFKAFSRPWICAALAYICAGLGGMAAAENAAMPQGASPDVVNTIAGQLEESVADVLRRKDGRAATMVKINGQGPFAFLIDTGANRSSISADLAEALMLPKLEQRLVNGVTGAQMRAIVRAEELSTGSLLARNVDMPVIETAALGGAQGLLAANELKSQRVILDFARDRYEVTSSRRGLIPDGAKRLRASLRFGHLVETPCRIGRVLARCIIDTGAEYTLINQVMLDALRKDDRTKIVRENVRLYGATDPVFTGTVVIMPPLVLGDMEFVGSAALASDAHIFGVWGLSRVPAVLLGMNVMRACDFLAIDFPRKALYVRIPASGIRQISH
jgi:predicted aspartyl protease